MIELRFDEGFKGDDPLQEIASNLFKYTGLESIINQILIEFQETREIGSCTNRAYVHLYHYNSGILFEDSENQSTHLRNPS